jgi:hypothetical protein
LTGSALERDALAENETLAATLRRVADVLDARPPALRPQMRASVAAGAAAAATQARTSLARAYLKLRRNRDRAFPDLFADPAWDLLLDLYAAAAERRLVSVSSACIAAAVPHTTALRWINMLEIQGLILRTPDPADRRSSHLRIAPVARDAVGQWLDQLASLGCAGRPED